MIIIKQIYFEDFTSLACDISDKFDMVKDDFGDVAIIAKYEEAKEIIAELVCIGYSLESIRMSKPEWENYYDEFIVSLNVDGIWCEPMKRNGKYLTDTSNVIYVLDNCSSRAIPYCKGDIVFEVGMVDDECDCDECCECACKDTDNSESTHISRDKNGNPEGFTKSWTTVRNGMTCYSSYSHYSSDVDMLRSIASDFGVKL